VASAFTEGQIDILPLSASTCLSNLSYIGVLSFRATLPFSSSVKRGDGENVEMGRDFQYPTIWSSFFLRDGDCLENLIFRNVLIDF
jgi:hypothetical protein